VSEPEQTDIFGETQPLEHDAGWKPEQPPRPEQPRLFEPQMEGQLDLLAATTDEGSSTDE
jgi:hypothetical protein